MHIRPEARLSFGLFVAGVLTTAMTGVLYLIDRKER